MPIWPENLNALAAFAEVAREYCELIDSLRDGRPAKFYTTLEELLPPLQLAILPVEKEMTDEDDSELKTLGLTPEESSRICRLIGAAVSDESEELVRWHKPMEGPKTEVDDEGVTRTFMFWDDLADIYCELLLGLRLWEVGTPAAQAAATWEWRYGYETHWGGDHLFDTMKTVHEVRYLLCSQ
jgi:uncharacterized protein DUF5063